MPETRMLRLPAIAEKIPAPRTVFNNRRLEGDINGKWGLDVSTATHSSKSPWQKRHGQRGNRIHTCTIPLHIRRNLDIVRGILLRHQVIHQAHGAIFAVLVVQEPYFLLFHGLDDVVDGVGGALVHEWLGGDGRLEADVSGADAACGYDSYVCVADVGVCVLRDDLELFGEFA